MNVTLLKMLSIKAFLCLMILHFTHLSFAQNADSTKLISHFSGAVTVTNNGISLIPTFSLGDPAAIFNLSLRKNKLSFEPEFRFALEGKPWSFLFWWRYKLLENNKFQMRIGAHPALNFRTIALPVNENGAVNEMIITRRFLAGEIAPSYTLSKNVSIGAYYLYSRGFDATAKNTHFITLNSNFSNITLGDQFYMNVTPQIFYLKQDKQDGFFVTSTLNISKRNFPLTLQTIMNKTIQSNITGSKDFVWNASLIYTFHKKYVAQ